MKTIRILILTLALVGLLAACQPGGAVTRVPKAQVPDAFHSYNWESPDLSGDSIGRLFQGTSLAQPTCGTSCGGETPSGCTVFNVSQGDRVFFGGNDDYINPDSYYWVEPGQGVVVLMLLLMIATLWVLVAWRREIRLRPAILGLAVAAIAVLGGLPFWVNSFVSQAVFVLLPALVPLMYIAGGLLFQRAGLGGSQLHAGHYGKALVSFLWGCLLFVPLGLINAAGGSPGRGLAWVNRWWMPFTL